MNIRRSNFGLIVLIPVLLFNNCIAIKIKDERCECSKLNRIYDRMAEQILEEQYYYFPPEKSIIFYADSTQTNPPINNNIQLIINCTNIKFSNPSKELVYYVNEDKLEEFKKWLELNCNNIKYPDK